MTSKSTRTKQPTGVNTGGGSVTIAPVWKSLHDFDGISVLGVAVAQYLNGFNPAQAMRVQYGTAYLVTLRGMLVKPGGFAVGGTAFTLPAGWRRCGARW